MRWHFGPCLLLLGACASGAAIDAALLARTPAVAPQVGPDGLSFLGYRAQRLVWTPWDNRRAQYTFEVSTPESHLVRAKCAVDSRSSLVLGDSASLSCDYDEPAREKAPRYSLVVVGRGTDLFTAANLSGSMSEHFPAPDHDTPGVELLRYRFGVRGADTTWNFLLQEEEYRKGEGVWRSHCCRDLTIVAAVQLRPTPRLVVDESVSPELRRSFALGAAALLVLREF